MIMFKFMLILREGQKQDITKYVEQATWQGSTKEAARRLDVTLVYSTKDFHLPKMIMSLGDTVVMSKIDTDGKEQELFSGVIFFRERDTSSVRMTYTLYDRLIYLCKSKTTRKFKQVTPESITQSICEEMRIPAGNIAATGIPVSFIADVKSGYEIIMTAYTEAHKKNDKVYMPVFRNGKLHVVEKGTLIEGYTATPAQNLQYSKYSESLENMVNRVLIVDDKGNKLSLKTNDDDIAAFGLIQDVYKEDKNRDTQLEAGAILQSVEQKASMAGLGNTKCIAGYSLQVEDEQLQGIFYIRSDRHIIQNGQHLMDLELEFDNLMDEEAAKYEKEKKEKKGKSAKGKKEKRSKWKEMLAQNG